MKKYYIFAVACLFTLIACDDTTETIGSSLTHSVDVLTVSDSTFNVTSRSIAVDSVMANSVSAYLGRVKDPETGVYVTGDFMAQFSIFEDYTFPARDSVICDENGLPKCDSCEVRFYIDSYYGDSLAVMKTNIQELSAPIEESVIYYSNYDPEKDGKIRKNGINITKTYSISDCNYSDSIRSTSSWVNNLVIPLNSKYTDKDGKEYANYGAYIMQKNYENPKYFHNSYSFVHNVCPGFYVKNVGGLGSMANVYLSQLNVYFHFNHEDSIYSGMASFCATEEVKQNTRLTNTNSIIKQMIEDKTCTYIKTPASIFTELTLPVLDIVKGHESDTINSAKIVLNAYNQNTDSKYALPAPNTLLMIQKDSLKSFFESGNIADYRSTYLASFSTSNTYTFNNISSLIQTLHKAYDKGVAEEGPSWVEKHPDWNNVVLVPVEATYVNIGESSILSRVSNNMSLSSVKLVGGEENPHSPITISVIYSKFHE